MTRHKGYIQDETLALSMIPTLASIQGETQACAPREIPEALCHFRFEESGAARFPLHGRRAKEIMPSPCNVESSIWTWMPSTRR